MNTSETYSFANKIAASLSGRKIYFTTSWDDGAADDIRLVEIAERHDIPVILFICPHYRHSKLLTPQQITDLGQKCEIGSHTMDHQPIDICTSAVAINQVVSGRKYLEDILGREVNHFSLVGGRYNANNLKAISDRVDTIRTCGIFSFQRPLHKQLIIPSLQIRFKGKTHALKIIAEALLRVKYAALGKVIAGACRGMRQHDFLEIAPELASKNQDIYLHLWGHSWDVSEKNAWSELNAIFAFLKNVNAQPLNYSEFINYNKS